jgi:RHH-type proline utilization regulon transcriptional repressor/proline dehydrogenase/delta 1-pyrroline-5-carboxylate dehydrogenase
MMPTGSAAVHALTEEAISLANRWLAQARQEETPSERATTQTLARMLRDEQGLALAVKFVDEVARPEDSWVAAKVLSKLTARQASFLQPFDRLLLAIGSKVAPLAPPVVVPLARWRLRQIVGHLVADANDPALKNHLASARADGYELNINLLGEAVLGEQEAASRTERTRALLDRDDIDYVSIKVSSLVSQITTWDTEGTVVRVLDRLRPLFQTAVQRTPKAFVNLDMEEYRDLDLTIEVFKRLLNEPEFHQLQVGIVLQAYLPDAMGALDRLLEFARERRDAGHADFKIRVVKGANLAMEGVDAEVHGWAQAPYTTKEDVDANYLRFVERVLRPDAMELIRLGVASHNLYDVAMAHLLATQRGVSDRVDVEMLQGMAPAISRVVKADVGSVLLYLPVVAPQDFDVAVSYLIRRLEENAQPQNFLHSMFSHSGRMAMQERRFRDAVAAIDSTPVGPNRSPERPPITDRFANQPNSDPALPATRAWAAKWLAHDVGEPTSTVLDSVEQTDQLIATVRSAAADWAARSGAERAEVLREAARQLEARRGELVAATAAEGGKTIEQSDPEISEAIDFARYYAMSAEQLGGDMSDGARFTPAGLTVVTPPWNFPVAIPIGGVLAALAAGSGVVIKPASFVPRCTEICMEALWAAGVPRELAEVVRVPDRSVSRHLLSHDDTDLVILTGSIETARMFEQWRTGRSQGPRVHAETSGKNAMIITPAADYDLAVRDLISSAFGHAGQKCSAASLAILVGSAASSKRFESQLMDAARSLRVGWPTDIGVTMGPVIEPPKDKLLRALTKLEPGESWLVKPRQLDESGRLWSPGVKTGVAPGSFFHLTECFGPVLGLMRASSLEQAIEWQNATAFGLTGGLYSLDPDEIATWTDTVEVGNAYVNRGTTGAIVQRQSFGGWKDSAVGPGAKAGGPNYVATMGSWESDGLPTRLRRPAPRVSNLLDQLRPIAIDQAEADWLDTAAGSDAYAWATEFGREADESGLFSESNIFRYRPLPMLMIRCGAGARGVELARLMLAAELAGTPVRISLDAEVGTRFDEQLGSTGLGRQLRDLLPAKVQTETQFTDAVADLPAGSRVRLLGECGDLIDRISGPYVSAAPVLATGRREMLGVLREQAVSRTMHRYGHVPPELRR